MFKSDLFKDKVALVTGGGSGIGLEIATQLLACGATVYIAGRKQERLDKALISLHSPQKARAFALDIRETESISRLADMIEAQSGRLDILINNAGGQFPSPAEDISEKGWNAVVNTNMNGTWFMTQEMAKRFFFKQKEGSVVNIVLNNFRGTPGMSHSGAARAGVMNFTKSSGLDNYPPELLAGVSAKIPMKRLGTCAEVAELTLFLAASKYITGETVYVDGGNRLWGDIWQIE
jgi:citronellol/citronellal dehydrogenase